MSPGNKIQIPLADGPVCGSIRPPGSKSITNRALICAALAAGDSTLHGALFSDDTQLMIDCLSQLGFSITGDPLSRNIKIVGLGGRIPSSAAELYTGNSGTTIRFLTPFVALGQGTFRLDGDSRMRERPIGDLLDALRQLGIESHCESDGRCPPVDIVANGLRGGRVLIRGNISSQFLSGLLMCACYADGIVQIQVNDQLVSRPYVELTTTVMNAFGVNVPDDPTNNFRIAHGQVYQGISYQIEPDATAASYFWATAAITGGDVTVAGLTKHSAQGDVEFCECLSKMGCQVSYGVDHIQVRGGALVGIDVNMNRISDTVQTLAAIALFAEGPTTIRGVAHIRHKETDRIGNLAIELRKLGAKVTELQDGLQICPPVQMTAAEIETYRDHRMAMSLALPGLKVPGVVIHDPGCTAKTYPNFFDDLARLVGAS